MPFLPILQGITCVVSPQRYCRGQDGYPRRLRQTKLDWCPLDPALPAAGHNGQVCSFFPGFYVYVGLNMVPSSNPPHPWNIYSALIEQVNIHLSISLRYPMFLFFLFSSAIFPDNEFSPYLKTLLVYFYVIDNNNLLIHAPFPFIFALMYLFSPVYSFHIFPFSLFLSFPP